MHALHPQINMHHKVYQHAWYTLQPWPLHSLVCFTTLAYSYNETSLKHAPKLKLAATCLWYKFRLFHYCKQVKSQADQLAKTSTLYAP